MSSHQIHMGNGRGSEPGDRRNSGTTISLGHLRPAAVQSPTLSQDVDKGKGHEFEQESQSAALRIQTAQILSELRQTLQHVCFGRGHLCELELRLFVDLSQPVAQFRRILDQGDQFTTLRQ